MSEIVLEQVTKRYGRVTAVEGVSFRAERGSFVVLLGPSGCGKSTLLRLIAGLEELTTGKITVEGRDVTRLDPAERCLSMVFQSYALFPHLSVAENIVFGLKVRGLPAAERRERLARVAELVGLAERLEDKPQQLSGGQRQRGAPARAIVAENPIAGREEPLSNLDAQLRHEMRVEIRALQQRLGITMVYVTHDQTEAMTMADRVVLMRDGHVEQNGAPEQLYSRPATAFTARFIGTPPMNLIEGGAQTIGIRPEHIRVVSQDGRMARVRSVEHLGADSIVLCEFDGQAISVRQDGFSQAAPGDEIRLAWAPSDEHQFDSTSGERRAAATSEAKEFATG